MELTGDQLTELTWERLKKHGSAFSLAHIADFCGVRSATVAEWISGSTRPIGGVAILKLWHFLAQAGVESPELEQARKAYPLGEYIGRLVAFDVLTMEQACSLCKVGKDAILRAARLQGKLSYARDHEDEKLDELKTEHGELLEMALSEFTVQMEGVPLQHTDTSAASSEELEELRHRLDALEAVRETSSVPAETRAPSSDGVRLDLVREVSTTLLAALADAIVADTQFSFAERELLRQLMGARGMFDLSNAVDHLCTERARNEGGNSK